MWRLYSFINQNTVSAEILLKIINHGHLPISHVLDEVLLKMERWWLASPRRNAAAISAEGNAEHSILRQHRFLKIVI